MRKPNTSFNVFVYNTPMCLIITTTKIASQFLLKYYWESKKTSSSEFTLSYESGEWAIDNAKLDFSSMEKEEEYLALKSWLIDKDLKKEVIILIRNPWDRFVSAFIQDYIKPIFADEETYHLLGTLLLESGPHIERIPSEEIKKHIDKWNSPKVFDKLSTIYDASIDFGSIDETLDINSTLNNVLASLIYRIISQDNYTVLNKHNSKYHLPILNLIHTIPQKNISVVDIDKADLTKILNKFEVGNGKSLHAYHTSKGMGDVVKSAFLQIEKLNDGLGEKYVRNVSNCLADESMAYEVLQKFFNEYKKKNKLE